MLVASLRKSDPNFHKNIPHSRKIDELGTLTSLDGENREKKEPKIQISSPKTLYSRVYESIETRVKSQSEKQRKSESPRLKLPETSYFFPNRLSAQTKNTIKLLHNTYISKNQSAYDTNEMGDTKDTINRKTVSSVGNRNTTISKTPGHKKSSSIDNNKM